MSSGSLGAKDSRVASGADVAQGNFVTGVIGGLLGLPQFGGAAGAAPFGGLPGLRSLAGLAGCRGLAGLVGL
jgi:hypothetical protein